MCYIVGRRASEHGSTGASHSTFLYSFLTRKVSKYVHCTRVLASEGFHVSFLLVWETFHCDDANFSPGILELVRVHPGLMATPRIEGTINVSLR